MHKKDVPDAAQEMLNVMGKLLNTNKDSSIWIVGGLLSGKKGLIAPYTVSTGSGSGSLRVTLSEDSASFPATAPLSLKVSKITGLNKCRKNNWTTTKPAIWSMMLPTFTRMGVY